MFKAQTEWNKPEEFPDLRQAHTIAIDLETHDPGLKSLGSGSVVGRGKVVGIAVAVDGYAGYFPFDHKGGGNLDKNKVLQWLRMFASVLQIKYFIMLCMMSVGFVQWVLPSMVTFTIP